MSKIETVKIVDPDRDGDYLVIEKHSFNPSLHRLFTEPVQAPAPFGDDEAELVEGVALADHEAAVQTARAEGYEAGLTAGREEGRAEGYETGLAAGRAAANDEPKPLAEQTGNAGRNKPRNLS
ncbi:MAG: hypothetical protein J0H82_06235 [Alphaproteobacteria bacterium]|jgi:flagellar biosynthesis/type III secretory pathway protein FliH|nr:hypothetical protein [Alphaproteobacteria bacterium]